jgi:hypothetical protein
LQEGRKLWRAELLASLVKSDDEVLRLSLLARRRPTQFRENLLTSPFFGSMGLYYGLLDLPNRSQPFKKHFSKLGISLVSRSANLQNLDFQEGALSEKVSVSTLGNNLSMA